MAKAEAGNERSDIKAGINRWEGRKDMVPYFTTAGPGTKNQKRLGKTRLYSVTFPKASLGTTSNCAAPGFNHNKCKGAKGVGACLK